MSNRRTFCESGKRVFFTRKEAKESAKRNRVKYPSNKTAKPYKCEICGAFHLTTATARQRKYIRDSNQD